MSAARWNCRHEAQGGFICTYFASCIRSANRRSYAGRSGEGLPLRRGILPTHNLLEGISFRRPFPAMSAVGLRPCAKRFMGPPLRRRRLSACVCFFLCVSDVACRPRWMSAIGAMYPGTEISRGLDVPRTRERNDARVDPKGTLGGKLANRRSTQTD